MLSLQWPELRVRLRLKKAYAHLRGAVQCGFRIDANASLPRRKRPSRCIPNVDEESPRLVPMEEEWPEPPKLECDAGQPEGNYGMTALPKRWEELTPSIEPRPPAVDGYEFATSRTELPRPSTPDLVEAYEVGAVAETRTREEEPGLYRLSRAEREPLREPPPPKLPLLEGIYFFPWQASSNLRVWLLLSLGIGISLVFAIAVYFFYLLIVASDRAGAILPLPLAALLIIGSITGAYGGSIFLAAVQIPPQATRRAGRRRVFRAIYSVPHLLAVVGALWPAGIVLMIEPAVAIVIRAARAAADHLFPIFFPSSLAAEAVGAIHGNC